MRKKRNLIFLIITAITLLFATVAMFLQPGGSASHTTADTEVQTVPDGFYKEVGDMWFYYENGTKSQKTDIIRGTVNNKEGMWMTVWGQVDFSRTSLEKTEKDTWQYVKNGEVTEVSSDSLSLILGEVINSVSAEKEPVAFGGCELSEQDKKLLQNEIDKNSGKGFETGFFVMNINTLSGFSYNADEKIYSASTIKGPYVVSLIKSDNTLLGKEKKRIAAILERSSNYDYESLRDNYGDECFALFSAETKSNLVVDKTRNFQYLTPRTLAHLWLGSYIFFESGETGQMLGEMFEKPQVSPVHKIFSDEFTTRTKAGWVTKNKISVTSDAGIVYTDNGDYLIVIMTTAPCDFSVAESMADAIKKVVL